MATGFTGDPLHRGSWFGLPDFGATEKLSDIFGQGRTAQGGSNMQGDQKQTVLYPAGTNSTGKTQFAPAGQGAYGYNVTQKYVAPQNSGNVSGNNTNTNQNNGLKTISEQEALNKGWDINNLPAGYTREVSQPSNNQNNAIEEQRNKVRSGINKQADSYMSYLDNEINALPQEEEEGQKFIEGQYETSKEAVDREKRRNTKEVGEQIVQLMRSGNDRFGSVGAGNSSATQVMLPYALGRESAKANAKIAEVALGQTKAIESEKNQMLYDLKTQVNDVKRRFRELRAGADERRQQALLALEENTLAGLETDARNQLAELRSRSATLKDWVTQRTAQLNDYKMQGYKVDPLSQVQEEVSANDFINPMVFAGIKKKQDSAYYA